MQRQFVAETLLIGRFQHSRPQMPMDLNGPCDDLPSRRISDNPSLISKPSPISPSKISATNLRAAARIKHQPFAVGRHGPVIGESATKLPEKH